MTTLSSSGAGPETLADLGSAGAGPETLADLSSSSGEEPSSLTPANVMPRGV